MTEELHRLRRVRSRGVRGEPAHRDRDVVGAIGAGAWDHRVGVFGLDLHVGDRHVGIHVGRVEQKGGERGGLDCPEFKAGSEGIDGKGRQLRAGLVDGDVPPGFGRHLHLPDEEGVTGRLPEGARSEREKAGEENEASKVFHG